MTLSNSNVSSRSERSLEMSKSSNVSLCGEKLIEMLLMQSLCTLHVQFRQGFFFFNWWYCHPDGGDNLNCGHRCDHRPFQVLEDENFSNALMIHDKVRWQVSRIMFSIGHLPTLQILVQVLKPLPHLSPPTPLSRSKANEAPD